MNEQTKGASAAPSLLRRLVGRSGVMTFDASVDAAKIASPSPRLMRLATWVEQNLRGGDVLDVGCWTGELARILAGSVACSYTGVDIEPAAQAVEAARKAVPNQRFLIVPTVESLPFDDRSFDVVALTEVIEHVPAGREGRLLAELYRVLKPGGSIILSTPYHNLLTPLDPAWFFGHRHYSVARIEEMAREQGLTVADVQFTGGIWTSLDTNLLYVYKHVLHRRYAGYAWLARRTRDESTFRRRALPTTLWCRLVR